MPEELKLNEIITKQREKIKGKTEEQLLIEAQAMFNDINKIFPCGDTFQFSQMIYGCVVYHEIICELERRGLTPPQKTPMVEL